MEKKEVNSKFDEDWNLVRKYLGNGGKIKNGTVYDGKKIGLRWYYWKNRYKKRLGFNLKAQCAALSDYELEKLLTIPQFVNWVTSITNKMTNYTFDYNLKLCMETEIKYGKIPVNIQINGKCVNLYKWVDVQKEKYKVLIGKNTYPYSPLTDYELAALKNWPFFNKWIDTYINKKSLTFSQKIDLCKNYLKFHKLDDMPCTKIIEHDGIKVKIGYWYYKQKVKCKKNAGIDNKGGTKLTQSEFSQLMTIPDFQIWFHTFKKNTPIASLHF